MRWLLSMWLSLTTCFFLTTHLAAAPAPLQEPPPAEEEEETYTEPAADEDRVGFGFQLAEANGGGRVEVLAGDFEYQEDEYFLGTGGVTIKYQDLQLAADVVRVDIPTNVMTAEGAVVLDEGPQRLVGDALEYDLTQRTGRVTNATAYLAPSYVFKSDVISKIDDDTFTLDNGTFTSCSEDNPPWSISMGRATVTVEDYARIKNARMKFKKAPVLYVPYLVWPTKTDRASGFLVPQPGYSDRRGVELSLGYFQTLGRSADTTFYVDLSSEEYFGFGNETRYRPSENTTGHFELYLIQDQDYKRIKDSGFDPPSALFGNEDLPDENRWKARWYHDTRDLWGGFRGVVNFKDYSDPTYRQDFERATRRQTASFIYSQAYLSGNFGQHSLNFLVDLRERISSRNFVDPDEPGTLRRVGGIVDTRRQLPEIEYRLRSTQLGSAPIYFSLDTNVHYLSIESDALSRLDENDEPSKQVERYGRGDIFPNFSLPLSTLPWLSVKVDLGGRLTHYTKSLDDKRFSKEDESLTRTFGRAAAEIVGPSLSRIFEKKKPGRFSKFKHIVEPRFVYTYLDDFEDELTADELMAGEDADVDSVPLFDEIDRQRLRNESSVSIINRLLAKPTDENEGGGFEIASFEIQQAFSFDGNIFLQAGNPVDDDPADGMAPARERLREGPLRAIFRYNPTRDTSLKAEGTYNTLFGQLSALSISGGTRIGPHNFGGSLRTVWGRDEDDDIRSNQARIFTSIALIPGRLTFDANVTFDLEGELNDMTGEQEGGLNILQQRYFIDYLGSCYSLRFEVRESTFGLVEDRDFRFSFTFKDVGTFLDLNGSL